MLLVLAGVGDWRGADLCERWAPAGARLMTPDDLALPGWRHEPARPCSGVAVAGGEPLATAEIAGVCTLLPCVLADELRSIRRQDREYVAAEMTAFLCAWLSSLSCAVLNRPSPARLCGPAWSPVRWLWFAAKAGLPTVAEPPVETLDVTVVGSRAFGASSAAERSLALELARRAGVPLLRVRLAGSTSTPVLAGADLWVEPGLDGVADAIGSLLADR